jgi:hypothetical protein
LYQDNKQRGEWILDKWKNKKRMRKGFIKNTFVAVDINTKKIASTSVTKEAVYDGKMLKELVNDVFLRSIPSKRYWQIDVMIPKTTLDILIY